MFQLNLRLLFSIYIQIIYSDIGVYLSFIFINEMALYKNIYACMNCMTIVMRQSFVASRRNHPPDYSIGG